MAISQEIEVCSHDSIYTGYTAMPGYNRKIKVYYSVPQNGTNEETGLLLFIAGFGGQATSNVYTQMRDEFADKYNLVTIQCDYFGYEFMQSAERIAIPIFSKEELSGTFSAAEIAEIYSDNEFSANSFMTVASKYDMEIRVDADISDETKKNFNDMGLLQAIDNIVTVLNVMNILYDTDSPFNSKKTIIYGHSHGAYLSYLCNIFAPKLFSLIIDNSAWIYPCYLDANRAYFTKRGKATLKIIFSYLAKKLLNDREILDISYLYSMFENNCKIISYHGSADDLISCREKADFCKKIENCIYNEISEDVIDNDIFKSTNHGLGADFKKLFKFTMDNFQFNFEKGNYIDLEREIIIHTSKHQYIFNYQNVFPRLIVK